MQLTSQICLSSIVGNGISNPCGSPLSKPCILEWKSSEWVNCLFNVTINDISVIYVTAHRCAGGLKKKLDLRSGSQRHRHFVGFFNVPVLAPTRDHPFCTVIPNRTFPYVYIKVLTCSNSGRPPTPCFHNYFTKSTLVNSIFWHFPNPISCCQVTR